MKQANQGHKQIHPVKGGYYYKTDVGIIYWCPDNRPNLGPNTGRRIVTLSDSSNRIWTDIRKER